MGVLASSYNFFDMAALTLNFINSENNIFYMQNIHGRLTQALPLLWAEHHLLHSYTYCCPSAATPKTMNVSMSATGKPF